MFYMLWFWLMDPVETSASPNDCFIPLRKQKIGTPCFARGEKVHQKFVKFAFKH